MPSTLSLLLTILTSLAVPPSARTGDGAAPWALTDGTAAVPCRLRIGSSGVPLVRVQVTRTRTAWFVVDTGASGTTVRADLARELALPAIGHRGISTIEARASLPAVRLLAFTIVGATEVYALEAVVHDMTLVRLNEPEAEGILGQDVLARYDYLIDHTRRQLTIGRFPAPADGEHLPLSWSAGRPVLALEPAPFRASGLVLDTGADVLVMEAQAARRTVGDVPPVGRTRARLHTHLGARQVEVEHHVGLRVGNVDLPPLALVRLPADAWGLSPEVGLLPASLFSRVYVSARTGRAAVWPK